MDRAYLRETSFAHMTRLTAEARTSSTSSWLASHIGKRRGYRPPRGGGSARSSDMSENPARADITSSSRGTRWQALSSTTG